MIYALRDVLSQCLEKIILGWVSFHNKLVMIVFTRNMQEDDHRTFKILLTPGEQTNQKVHRFPPTYPWGWTRSRPRTTNQCIVSYYRGVQRPLTLEVVTSESQMAFIVVVVVRRATVITTLMSTK